MEVSGQLNSLASIHGERDPSRTLDGPQSQSEHVAEEQSFFRDRTVLLDSPKINTDMN